MFHSARPVPRGVRNGKMQVIEHRMDIVWSMKLIRLSPVLGITPNLKLDTDPAVDFVALLQRAAVCPI